MSQELILHAHMGGPNPFKVAILLESLSVPYKVKIWEFGDAPNGVKGTQFLRINENGRVPALEDPNTGVVSWESGAVINYVLRVYDKAHKYHFGPGASEQDRVDFDKWIFFLVSTLGPMMGQTNWYRHYSPAKNEEALERYVAQSYRCYDVLEAQLLKSNGKSVLQSGWSAVDMHFYPWMYQHKMAQLDIGKYPSIRNWLQECEARPEVKRAYEMIPNGEKVKA